MDVINCGIESILQNLEKRNVNFHSRSILVTGGAGFLGSWISDVLVRQHANVICVDNFSSGLEENTQHLLNKKNFSIKIHDISQPLIFNREIDLVIHLASRASPLEFKHFPIQILKANIMGAWVALGIAKKHNSRFLYASSSEIYGDPNANFIPTPETYYGNVNSIGPRSCYDEAKRAGEAFTIAYHLQNDVDVRIVRIFNTYGPRLRAGNIYGRVVSRFIEQALCKKPITVFGDGEQTRSFAYVTDVVEGILLAAHNTNINGEVFNIGNNREIKIIDLAQKILELTSSNSKIEYRSLPIDDPKRRCPDLKKIWKLLSWRPMTQLEEGLRNTITWIGEQ